MSRHTWPSLPARVLVAVVVVPGAMLSACGDDAASPPEAPPGADVVVTATDAFDYVPADLEVERGDRVGLVCEGTLPHDLVVETAPEDVLVVECGGREAAEGEVDLEPGTYTFFCDIPGHREAGMVGEITVR